MIEQKPKTRIVASASLRFFKGFPSLEHKAEFGTIVHDDYQGKGCRLELTKHLLEIAQKKGLKKATVHVGTETKKAFRMYEKCGFKIEAIRAKERFADGKYYDNYVMSILF